MNCENIKGSWNIIVGKLEQKMAQFAGDDAGYTNGKEHELLGRIQKKDYEIHETHQHDDGKCRCGGCEDCMNGLKV